MLLAGTVGTALTFPATCHSEGLESPPFQVLIVLLVGSVARFRRLMSRAQIKDD